MRGPRQGVYGVKRSTGSYTGSRCLRAYGVKGSGSGGRRVYGVYGGKGSTESGGLRVYGGGGLRGQGVYGVKGSTGQGPIGQGVYGSTGARGLRRQGVYGVKGFTGFLERPGSLGAPEPARARRPLPGAAQGIWQLGFGNQLPNPSYHIPFACNSGSWPVTVSHLAN